MHNFKDQNILRDYVGKTIVALCVNFHYYDIVFDLENHIRIYSTDEFYLRNKYLFSIENCKLKMSHLTNSVVTSAKILSETEAVLIVDGAFEVILTDSFDNYESIELKINGGVIPI